MIEDEVFITPQGTFPREGGKASAAVISASILCIVTLSRRNRRLILDPDGCCFLTLPERDQASAARFYGLVSEYFAQSAIRELRLRVSYGGGQYTAKPIAFKIETILQLVPRLQVELTPTLTVSAWLRNRDPKLAKPSSDLRRPFKEVQLRAIEMAAFVLSERSCGVVDND